MLSCRVLLCFYYCCCCSLSGNDYAPSNMCINIVSFMNKLQLQRQHRESLTDKFLLRGFFSYFPFSLTPHSFCFAFHTYLFIFLPAAPHHIPPFSLFICLDAILFYFSSFYFDCRLFFGLRPLAKPSWRAKCYSCQNPNLSALPSTLCSRRAL